MPVRNNPDIFVYLGHHFPRNRFAARIADILDKLIGRQVTANDERSKKVSKDMHFHFDAPEGRIVKIEKGVEEANKKLDMLLRGRARRPRMKRSRRR